MPARDRQMRVEYQGRMFGLVATYADAAPWTWSVAVAEFDEHDRPAKGDVRELSTGYSPTEALGAAVARIAGIVDAGQDLDDL